MCIKLKRLYRITSIHQRKLSKCAETLITIMVTDITQLLQQNNPFLSFDDFEKVIHAFVSVRLEYCNSLYVSVCQTALNPFQLVPNAASRSIFPLSWLLWAGCQCSIGLILSS